ncbi:helix-turn-helix domain-containing protein [Duganella sp. FT80W]|uniref:Helix-turn-helix domain-containing protein n=1 Tax=Duganella guangzhouensis TaxID=2666084 RepID=A0A6I2L8Z8_9BURK|nr:helix-turn-helix domain-containing protein [Duganella guangzhouensis]MRW94518.1 helix-turn-helix domain-containing protein [Duganella guangzhouensis]
MTNSATTATTLDVQVLCFPETIMGTVFNAVDVLKLASTVLKLRNPYAESLLSWKVVMPEGSPTLFDNSLVGVFTSGPSSAREVAPQRRLIVVPALYVSNALELPAVVARYPGLLTMLKQHVAEGGLVAACSTGLIFPAVAGMLDGLSLDAHWAFKAYFRRGFPGCDFSSPDAMSFYPQLYSCVAPSQQTEFMIAILARLLDQQVAEGCTRLLHLQQERQQLGNQMAKQDWLALTSDSPVFRAKQWLEANVEQPYDLAALAAVASSSERTLLRHFQAVLGMTPLDYLQDLRVQRAKVMLEISLNSLQTIANACGYANGSTFSKLFRRAMGMSPGEYRKHHTFRTKRAHWRVTTHE